MPTPVVAPSHTHRAQHPIKSPSNENKKLGRLGNLVSPVLFVVLAVATFSAWKRRTLTDPLPIFIGRVALALVFAWLITHPQKYWHSFPSDKFDVSAHTAFFLVPGIALCTLDARWWRLVLPLGVAYSVFMTVLRFHTWPEVLLTALFVGVTTTLCFVVGRRVEPTLLNSKT